MMLFALLVAVACGIAIWFGTKAWPAETRWALLFIAVLFIAVFLFNVVHPA